MADWQDWARFVHVVAVMMWTGGSMFAISMVLPSVNAAGASGRGFMMTVIRRGGFGKYFGPVGGLSILSGLVLYWGRGYDAGPFANPAASMVTIGAILAILAYAEGLAVNMPTERKLKALVTQMAPQGPTPEQAARLEALASKIRKASLRGTGLIVLAFVAMVARTLVG